MNFKASWGALLALVGLSATAAPSTPLTEASVEELNTRAQAQADQLVNANNLVATLTTERDTHAQTIKAKETELATAGENLKAKETELATANTKVTDLEAKVKEYGKQPGALGTNPLATGDDKSGTAEKNPIVDPNAAHNRAAAAYFG